MQYAQDEVLFIESSELLGRKGKADFNGCCISTLITSKMFLVSSAISYLCCVS